MIRRASRSSVVLGLLASLAPAPRTLAAGTAQEAAAASPEAADARTPGTAALRKRVQRFYVLSYLGRPSEMWDVFSAALKRQLGDDKSVYVRRSLRNGYELYQSKVESVRIAPSGLSAVVDVSLQAKVPGSPQAAWRHHRMLWAFEDDAWRYAGSMDVTEAADDAPMDASLLQAVPGVGGSAQPEYAGGADLLPERVVLQAPAATMSTPPASGAHAPLASRSKERWDLVAVAPDGSTPPTVSTATAPAPAPPPGTVAAPAAIVASAAPDVPAREAPRDRERDAPLVSGTPSGDTAPPELAELVDRAATGIAVRRVKALKAVSESRHPAVPALLVAALPRALPDAQAGFLELLARRGGALPSAAAVARERLGAPEPMVRRAAFAALAALGTAADSALLLSRLEVETDRPARLAAIEGLGTLGGAVGTALSRLLADGQAPAPERAAAADAIGRAHALDAAPAVLAVLAARAPEGALAEAMDAAGHLGTPACVSALESLAASGPFPVAGDEGSRLVALRALAMAGSAGSGERLARHMVLLGNDASSHDVEVVAVTGEIDALLVLLRHPRPLVRGRAAELASRMVSSPGDATRAVTAISEALVEEGDDVTLLTLSDARTRLAGTSAARR